MIDAPLALPVLPALPAPVILPLVGRIWIASRRDRVEGVVAYCLLGAVACAMLYIACMAAMFFTKV